MLRVVAPTNQTFLAPKQADLLQDRFERGFPFPKLKAWLGYVMPVSFLVIVELCVMIQTTKTERIGIPWDPIVLIENLDS